MTASKRTADFLTATTNADTVARLRGQIWGTLLALALVASPFVIAAWMVWP